MQGLTGTRVLGMLLLALCLWGSVGCTSTRNQSDYDAVLSENNELRGQIASLEGERAMWSETKRKLEAENADLAQALEKMKNEGQVGMQGQLGQAQVYSRGSDVVIEVAGDVLFDSGSITLKSSAKKTLDQVAQALNNDFAGHQIRVEGHTDSDPIRKSKWKSNEHLSFERALAVEKYLKSKGVSSKRMYAAAFGPNKPKATKAQSRRVEIIVLGNQ